MIRKFIIFIALVSCAACANIDKKGWMSDKDTSRFGAILTQVSCPTFTDWLRPNNIKSANSKLTAIAHAETYLNCEGIHSLNRKTKTRLISLPAGNYFLNQSETSHLFNLTYEKESAFSFKVLPDTITYIGDITIEMAPSQSALNQLELNISVVDKLSEQLVEMHATAPDHMKDYRIEKMLWRPVITKKMIDQLPEIRTQQKHWVTDSSPDSFF